MLHIDYPFHFDHRGRTATADDDRHVRDMIEQLLFTSPGERVNRPDFGTGLLQLVFDPTSPELAEAVRFTVQSALERWLGEAVEVAQLEVNSEDATLRLLLRYTVRRTGQTHAEQFERRTG